MRACSVASERNREDEIEGRQGGAPFRLGAHRRAAVEQGEVAALLEDVELRNVLDVRQRARHAEAVERCHRRRGWP